MKLLIDVSEEDYKECVFRKDLLSLGGEPTDLTFNMRMEKLIANGIPLEEEFEKIKAEFLFKCKENLRFDNDIVLECFTDLVDKRISELKGENNG